MDKIIEQLSEYKLIPVIKLNDPDKAVDLAKALIDGGLPVAEVTFRAAGADKAIKLMADNFPDMLVGAGTVLNIEQVNLAIDSGAKFIVSPGFVPEVVSYCQARNIPVIPGCTNPSEVTVAYNMGLEVVKFFPAEAMGGLKVLKALAGPFSTMKFVPTGGINAKNVKDYFAFSKNIACGGSWMVPPDYVDNNNFDGIRDLVKEAIEAIK